MSVLSYAPKSNAFLDQTVLDTGFRWPDFDFAGELTDPGAGSPRHAAAREGGPGHRGQCEWQWQLRFRLGN
eukprot:2802875-Rhodomonas_salina.1